MREKSFLKHFTIIGSGILFNLILGILTTPLITRIVDPTEYGQHAIFLLYANIALLVLLLGMNQALVRFYYERPELEYKRALLFRCVQWPAITTLAVAAGVMACSLTGLIQFEFSPVIMALLCAYTFFELLFQFGLNVNRLEYNTKLYSLLNIVLKAAYIGIALPLLLLVKRDYLLILCIASAGSAFIVLAVSILSQRRMWNLAANRDSACTVRRSTILKFALPLTVSMGITYLFQALDKLSLNHYCDYATVGVYSSTMTIVNIFAIIQTTFNTLWSPMAVEHYTKDPEDKTFYQKGNQAITVVMFFLGLSLILCKDVFALLLGEKYREAAYILPFLIFHPIMYTISETTVSGITFMKKSWTTIVIAGVSCLVNFIGNTILVPKLAGQGAAISTGLSYIVFFALRTIISNHYFPVDFKLGKFAIITAAAVGYAFYNTFVQFNWISIVSYLVCVALLAILYLDTVKWGLQYLRGMLQKLFSRKGSE